MPTTATYFKCSFCGRTQNDHMLTLTTTCRCGSYLIKQVQDVDLLMDSTPISSWQTRVEDLHKYLTQQFHFAEIAYFSVPAVEALEYIEAGWPEACVLLPARPFFQPLASWVDNNGLRRIEAKDLIVALRLTRFLRPANA